MLSIRHWKPLFIQHQPILICLSYLAPIEIHAITLGPIVISKNKIGEVTKNHESIHFQQPGDTLYRLSISLSLGLANGVIQIQGWAQSLLLD